MFLLLSSDGFTLKDLLTWGVQPFCFPGDLAFSWSTGSRKSWSYDTFSTFVQKKRPSKFAQITPLWTTAAALLTCMAYQRLEAGHTVHGHRPQHHTCHSWIHSSTSQETSLHVLASCRNEELGLPRVSMC